MKHILPILTLTTLAAAASADSMSMGMGSSGLSYNRVGLGYNTDTKGYSVSASSLIGSSNFLLSGSTTIGGAKGSWASNGADAVFLGYVFKGVAYGVDATVAIGSNESYGLNLRKDLGYNIEAAVSYGHSKVAQKGANNWGVELAYNVNKQVQLAIGYADSNASGAAGNSHTDLTVRYNF